MRNIFIMVAFCCFACVSSASAQSVTKGKSAAADSAEKMPLGSAPLADYYCTDGNYADEAMLSDHELLKYNVVYHIKDGEMVITRTVADVTDTLSKDTTSVEISHLRCNVLSNPPLIYAGVFDIVYKERTYVVHFLYDIRTYLNKSKHKFQNTQGCYLLE